MIRERLLEDLAQFEVNLGRGEDAIARQEQIVADLEQMGHTELEQKARQVLTTFRDLQKDLLRDVGRLRREIGHEALGQDR